MPAPLYLLAHLKESQNLDAAGQALSDVCSRAENPQSHSTKLASLLHKTQPAQKVVLLRALSAIGVGNALRAVRQGVDDRDGQVRTATIRSLGA
ncbi:hypothetical protein HQ563_09915 [bacterium]|nr:hypothetical protein [bacterium]